MLFETKNQESISFIQQFILQKFHTPISDLYSSSKKGDLPLIRFISYFLLKKYFNLSISRIAEIMNKDRSSVRYGLKQLDVDFVTEVSHQFEEFYPLSRATVDKPVDNLLVSP